MQHHRKCGPVKRTLFTSCLAHLDSFISQFIFGVRAEEVPKLRQERSFFRPSPAFQRVVQ